MSGHQQLVSNEMRTFDKRDFSEHEHSQTNSSGSWTYQVRGGVTIRLENDGRNYIGFQANLGIDTAEPITGGSGRSVTSGGSWQNQSGQQLADYSSDEPIGPPVGLDADSIAQDIAPVREAPTVYEASSTTGQHSVIGDTTNDTLSQSAWTLRVQQQPPPTPAAPGGQD